MNPLDKPFDQLCVGDRFATRGRTVSEADIDGFAALTWDTHPLHTDADWAAASRFDGRIAHGMLVLSYAAGLVPFDAERVVALRGLRDAAFKAPVRAADTIHVEGEVTDLRELDARHGLVTVRWRVIGAGGRMAARMTVDALWLRDEATAAQEAAAPVEVATYVPIPL